MTASIEIYILASNSGGVPEMFFGDNGATKSELIGSVFEYAENHEIDLALRITCELGVWETEDISDEVFEAAISAHPYFDELKASDFKGRIYDELIARGNG